MDKVTRGQATRARIVAAAAALFHERGYASVALDELLARLELTKGSLYHHFSSKKEVALAVVADEIVPTIRRRMIDPVVAAERPVAAIRRIVAALRRAPLTGCPLNNLASELALHDADLQRAVAAAFDEWEAAWTSALRRAGKKRPRARALTYMALVEGAQALAKAQQSPAPLQAILRTLTPDRQ